jgi:hypothetical protein
MLINAATIHGKHKLCLDIVFLRNELWWWWWWLPCERKMPALSPLARVAVGIVVAAILLQFCASLFLSANVTAGSSLSRDVSHDVHDGPQQQQQQQQQQKQQKSTSKQYVDALTTAGEELQGNNTSSKLPLCYSHRDARKRPLLGDWKTDLTKQHRPPYWNLSCPLEFSSYSCVHQEKYEQAEYSAYTQFIPKGCRMLDLDQEKDDDDDDDDFKTLLHLKTLLENRQVHFWGDSFIRQVFLAWSCLLHRRGWVKSMHIPWRQCEGRHFPCGDRKNCIPCGEHSGTLDPITIELFGGTVLTSGKPFEAADLQNLTNDSILIMDSGAHGNAQRSGQRQKAALQKVMDEYWHDNNNNNIPTMIHVVTWESHFGTPDRRFVPPKQLTGELKERIGGGEQIPCHETYDGDRFQDEYNVLKSMMDHVDGMLWLDGTNNQGRSKVGVGSGPRGGMGDCQHFCLPGPPDEMVRAMETLLIQLLLISEKSQKAAGGGRSTVGRRY